MLVTGSSFARHDDVWVWRSNSTHSPAWPDPGDFGFIARSLYKWEDLPFFYFYLMCPRRGLDAHQNFFLYMKEIERCPAPRLVTTSTELSQFTVSYCVILYRCREVISLNRYLCRVSQAMKHVLSLFAAVLLSVE
jgi:hypothetical protein